MVRKCSRRLLNVHSAQVRAIANSGRLQKFELFTRSRITFSFLHLLGRDRTQLYPWIHETPRQSVKYHQSELTLSYSFGIYLEPRASKKWSCESVFLNRELHVPRRDPLKWEIRAKVCESSGHDETRFVLSDPRLFQGFIDQASLQIYIWKIINLAENPFVFLAFSLSFSVLSFSPRDVLKCKFRTFSCFAGKFAS